MCSMRSNQYAGCHLSLVFLDLKSLCMTLSDCDLRFWMSEELYCMLHDVHVEQLQLK